MTFALGRRLSLVTLVAGALPVASVAAGFNDEQATRGQSLYNTQCAYCHGFRLEGINAPALSAETMQNFSTARGLYDFITVAMPPQDPGKLGEDAYLDIIAYMLAFNGAESGDEALTADMDALASIDLVAVTAAGAVLDGGSAFAAADVPQAYTWGMSLPGGDEVPEGAEAATATAAGSGVPQAFTWGQELPTASN